MVRGARMDLGWLPVAWGKGCILIGSCDQNAPPARKAVSVTPTRPPNTYVAPEPGPNRTMCSS
eukprot:7969383-Pyramimonas_sp.AAC.1